MNTEEELIPIENYFAETLRETLEEIEPSQKEVAQATGILETHLSAMKLGKRRCTAEYDMRLGRYFGTSKGYWMRLQLAYEMDLADREKGEAIEREVPVLA